MNKKTISIILSFIFLILLLGLSVNLVSAGLCKGSDGYYHDCDDFGYRYYNRNFYPNYKTEYYKETTASSSSVISITQDRHTYEELTASSYAESNIEYLKKERDYSYPKYRYDRYGRYRYDDCYYWDDCDYRYNYRDGYYDGYYRDKYYDRDNDYEWDEDQLVVFVNNVEPTHYRRRANTENRMNDWDNHDDWKPDTSLTWPYHSERT